MNKQKNDFMLTIVSLIGGCSSAYFYGKTGNAEFLLGVVFGFLGVAVMAYAFYKQKC